MAVKGIVWTAPYVSINGVDLSDHIKSIGMPIEVAEVEATCGGNTAMARLAGLLDWSLAPELAQDFGAGSVDATLGPLVLAGTEFVVSVRPSTAAVSATNPQYSGSARLFGYDPINGAIGDHATTSPTIKCSNGVALTRATS